MTQAHATAKEGMVQVVERGAPLWQEGQRISYHKRKGKYKQEGKTNKGKKATDGYVHPAMDAHLKPQQPPESPGMSC